MFYVQAIDETWGDRKPASRRASAETYADAKALVCQVVTIMLTDVIKAKMDRRVKTLSEVPGETYSILVEWTPSGQLHPEDDTRSQWTHTDYDLQYAVVVECGVDNSTK
jgi:hypothetical protein